MGCEVCRLAYRDSDASCAPTATFALRCFTAGHIFGITSYARRLSAFWPGNAPSIAFVYKRGIKEDEVCTTCENNAHPVARENQA